MSGGDGMRRRSRVAELMPDKIGRFFSTRLCLPYLALLVSTLTKRYALRMADAPQS
jgi:hypothetical protein